MRDFVSEVMRSNLYTMGITSKKDPRQAIGASYSIPSVEIRLLRAQLILEEALETIQALGFEPIDLSKLFPTPEGPNLEAIIDGVCDMDYVGIGTLVSCGVFFDLDHKREVCEANNRKLPNGIATFNANGKFLKPNNWVGPDHEKIRRDIETSTTAQIVASELREGKLS